MNTRSCLLTVGVSALLATGTVLTAAPASAAPGSAECVAAQSALKTQLGIASVDISLANQLRTALATFESLDAQLEPLYVEAELALADELAALDAAEIAAYDASLAEEAAKALLTAAQSAEAAASSDLAAAEQAVLDAQGDAAAVEAAEAQHDLAQKRYDIAVAATAKAQVDADTAWKTFEAADAAFAEANDVFLSAADVAYATAEILALEAQYGATIVSFEDAFTRLGLTEGTDPEQLIALADAAVAACSGPAVQTPVVRAAAPQQQRGLNIQTAVHDAGATDPANLALLAGLAGLGAAAATGAVVVVRRRSAGRA